MNRLFLTTAFAVVLLATIATTGAYAQMETPAFRSDIVRLAPTGVLADTINVWGAVSMRGRFMVPRGTTVTQMLSYTGGPGIGGSSIRSTGDSRSIFGFHSRPQVEVYLHRFDEAQQREVLELWTYRLRDPFPEGMRNYQLQNGEYITVHVRTRPTTLQYVLFGITTLGSLAGGYFLVERVFL